RQRLEQRADRLDRPLLDRARRRTRAIHLQPDLPHGGLMVPRLQLAAKSSLRRSCTRSAPTVGCKFSITWKKQPTVGAAPLKQHQLRDRRTRDPGPPRRPAAEEQKEVAADPFLRFAVVSKLPLVRVK